MLELEANTGDYVAELYWKEAHSNSLNFMFDLMIEC